MWSNMNRYLELSEEVLAAKENGKAIVALESTIISHGMPYPQNLEMANKVETIIRKNNAVPATIALMDGKIKIGLSPQELEAFAKSENVAKVSRRDIAVIVATKKMGATTVASTMYCAQLAGIRIFVTGGIGGVHRGAETTMDISADLEELAQTNVAVVCAGAKSILDLNLTMEYLETKGVPVIGYQTNVLPSFFARTSEIKLDYSLDEPKEIAEVLKVKWDLGIEGGAVIANPIPEHSAMSEVEINYIIETALTEASRQGIKGKEVTPYLLKKVVEMSNGKSLEANVALVYHNALIGAKIATALQELS